MGIVRFDPMRGFESLSRRLTAMANEMEKGYNIDFGGFTPRIDISEDEKYIFLNAEVPGIAKEDVRLTVNDENVLVIKGTKKRDDKEEVKNENISFIRVERSFGEFQRSFMLPENVNKESINAKFENGVLTISLEKIEPAKPKEIEVSIA